MIKQRPNTAAGTRAESEGEGATGAPATPHDASPRKAAARSEKRRHTRRRFLKGMGALTLVAVGVPAHARYVEPNLIDVSEHTVYLPGLPQNSDGLRIVQLTDLHRGPVTPDDTIRQAVAAAAELKPDLFVLTGDYVKYDLADATPLADLLRPLAGKARLGLFGCLGNHDYADWTGNTMARALSDRAGVTMLRNESRLIEPGLFLAGIEDEVRGRPDIAKALTGAPADQEGATVVLAHNPRSVFSCDTRPLLMLSGHTHGGQIRIPGLAPRVPPDMKGFPLVDGWGRFDKAWLFVNRGVGMTGFPYRLGCRPEVSVITLRRGDGPPVRHGDLAEKAFRKAQKIASDARRLIG